MFSQLVGHEIVDVQFHTLADEFRPFAIRIATRSDFVLVSSTATGSTLETSRFNRHGNLSVFESLGPTKVVSVRAI